MRKFDPGSQDFSKNLVNDYMLLRSSNHNVSIMPKSPYKSNTPIIPTKVLELNVYKDYVLAYRQGLKRRSSNNQNDLYMIPNPNEFDYWILDTKSPVIFKKMDELDFKRIKDSLKIPQSIKLINVYEY